jgi:hypothetical protein
MMLRAGVMNDYFAGWLASERQSDYLREVAKDEQAALLSPVGDVERKRRGSPRAAAALLMRRLRAFRPHHGLAVRGHVLVGHRR